jgi:hypothetical protein
MLDGVLRSHIDRATNPVGLALARAGVSANQGTLMGLMLGAVAAGLIALGAPLVWALVFILASRLADGLDGAVAGETLAARAGAAVGSRVGVHGRWEHPVRLARRTTAGTDAHLSPSCRRTR